MVTRSYAKVEYRAMTNTVCKVFFWLRWLLEDLDANQHGATPLICDNEVAHHIAVNLVFHERTKHVEMYCYFVHERVNSGDVKPCHI